MLIKNAKCKPRRSKIKTKSTQQYEYRRKSKLKRRSIRALQTAKKRVAEKERRSWVASNLKKTFGAEVFGIISVLSNLLNDSFFGLRGLIDKFEDHRDPSRIVYSMYEAILAGILMHALRLESRNRYKQFRKSSLFKKQIYILPKFYCKI